MARTVKLVIVMLLLCSRGYGAASVGAGYNNPVMALFGANFLYTWTDFAMEAGLGYIRTGTGNSTFQIAGDVDLKYMFLGGSFRPFLQVGTGWTFSTNFESNNFGIGSDNVFGGAGFFVFGSGVYSYFSYNTGPPGLFMQAGLGFDL